MNLVSHHHRMLNVDFDAANCQSLSDLGCERHYRAFRGPGATLPVEPARGVFQHRGEEGLLRDLKTKVVSQNELSLISQPTLRKQCPDRQLTSLPSCFPRQMSSLLRSSLALRTHMPRPIGHRTIRDMGARDPAVAISRCSQKPFSDPMVRSHES
ncbi:hypothetical protein OH76DRAFT_1225592 [Lentinus brumalis]|uniref:Uncharacterized protein n=1 Tax=Lentinus brumalis TaxID=2498619 RepID=A0A371DLU2_9APHY|nr:hypothetical protein OH76DRAFT_1225592 [Polyporus brumalis]